MPHYHVAFQIKYGYRYYQYSAHVSMEAEIRVRSRNRPRVLNPNPQRKPAIYLPEYTEYHFSQYSIEANVHHPQT